MLKRLIKLLLPNEVFKLVTAVYIRLIKRDSPKRTSPVVVGPINCVVSYNHYGAFCVPKDSMDRPAAQVILRGKVWEEGTIARIIGRKNPGDIIHAGTYFGDFLPALSRACTEEERVWAFEPVKQHYDCANITLVLNNISNCSLIHGGLGSSSGIDQIVIKDKYGNHLGGSSRFVNDSNGLDTEATQSAEIFAIDLVVPSDRPVSAIHLDIEGFEQEALAGAAKTIARNLPLIILETVPNEKWLDDNLFCLGYKEIETVMGNTVFEVS